MRRPKLDSSHVRSKNDTIGTRRDARSGPRGSTVASRLAENPTTNVLVIEAGVRGDSGVLDIEAPILAPDLQFTSMFDWNYTTVVQPGLGNRKLSYSRGKVLGGTSKLTAKELGGEFAFNQDISSGDPLGVGRFVQGSYGSGIRSDAATSYIEPLLSRGNIDILVQTQVTKLLQKDIHGTTSIFRGVQFAQSIELR
ncbi:hypothetical protein C8Q79DRAFT_929212 [Trametes meyenii]|nr:hypothetical protein C8Q79DRAFT_929212 [Trametes meyenii]